MIKKKKIKHDIYQLLPKLKEKLEKEEDIIFVYIFGSYGKGKIFPLSDVDIALYLKENGDLFERKVELMSIISEVLKTDEIDLVILNYAPCSIIHSVFKTGKLLFSKDEGKRISFLSRNLKEYMDFSYHREKVWDGMRKRIKEGKFGI